MRGVGHKGIRSGKSPKSKYFHGCLQLLQLDKPSAVLISIREIVAH